VLIKSGERNKKTQAQNLSKEFKSPLTRWGFLFMVGIY
jgi:hypothetical protein